MNTPCVECGKEDVPLIQGSCAECFLVKTPVLEAPLVLDIELCAHCDARRVGKHWVDPAEGMPMEWIREDAVKEILRMHHELQEPYIQLSERQQDEKNFEYTVEVEGHVHGVPVEQNLQVRVRQRNGVCDRCSRMYGSYYAAIIQLRGSQRDVREDELQRAHRLIGDELDRQRASGNRFAFLSKSGPEHGGFDYYLGDIESARQVCRILRDRLDATVVENPKLVGRKEGEDVYRVTFLVRIRLFSRGDFAIDSEGRLMQVIARNTGRMQVADLQKLFKTRVHDERLKRLGGKEILREAVVVSYNEDEIQAMDPVDYKTLEFRRPPGMDEIGETVQLFLHDEQWHLPYFLPAEWSIQADSSNSADTQGV